MRDAQHFPRSVLPPIMAPSAQTTVEPMQLGTTRLSEKERLRLRQLHLCFYCSEAGHRRSGCPNNQSIPRTIEHLITSFNLPIQIAIENVPLSFTMMVNSGATLSLIHKALIERYNIPTQPCHTPIKMKAIDDNTIGDGITHQTIPLQLD